MRATLIITEGNKTWTCSDEDIYTIQDLLQVCRDGALASGFGINEVAADNDLGDVFWSDDF